MSRLCVGAIEPLLAWSRGHSLWMLRPVVQVTRLSRSDWCALIVDYRVPTPRSDRTANPCVVFLLH